MTRFRGLTISLIIHALLFGLLNLWSDQFQKNPLLRKLHSLIEYEQETKDHYAVSLEIDETPQKKKKKANFLAENSAQVDEESQARFWGETVNRRFPNLDNIKKPAPKKEDPAAHAFKDEGGTLAVEGVPPKRKELPLGISTIQSSLDNQIKYGDFTALNTDRNLFFSFYTRAESRIRFNWEDGVNRVVESLSFQNLKIRDDKVFTTEVEVLLDEKGSYLKTLLYRSSGVEALDNIVVQTFEKSAPFVNPPRGIVRDDGLIHLNYVFRVYYSPRFYARPQ